MLHPPPFGVCLKLKRSVELCSQASINSLKYIRPDATCQCFVYCSVGALSSSTVSCCGSDL